MREEPFHLHRAQAYDKLRTRAGGRALTRSMTRFLRQSSRGQTSEILAGGHPFRSARDFERYVKSASEDERGHLHRTGEIYLDIYYEHGKYVRVRVRGRRSKAFPAERVEDHFEGGLL